MKKIHAPLTREEAKDLVCGESVLISGTIYTARDAAHKRLCEMLARGEEMPFELKDSVIYYAGPAPAGPGRVIGSVGPTTSYRMDAYAPELIRMGNTGIPSGRRGVAVVAAMKECGAVYFGAIGGCGALLSRCVTSAEVVAFPDLGTEAVRRLTVVDFPAVVVIDAEGEDLYEKGRAEALARL